jgi:hypothetical protein
MLNRAGAIFLTERCTGSVHSRPPKKIKEAMYPITPECRVKNFKSMTIRHFKYQMGQYCRKNKINYDNQEGISRLYGHPLSFDPTFKRVTVFILQDRSKRFTVSFPYSDPAHVIDKLHQYKIIQHRPAQKS